MKPLGLGVSRHSFYTSGEEPPLSIFNSWDIPGFNFGLLMRRLIGVGTPRSLPGRLSAVWATL